ncbi:MAG: hypothetical protein K2H92_00045, partial [Bacteroidaceae bacterium]|nr:hypothetical protein [Bacteroidaceae bacterium]
METITPCERKSNKSSEKFEVNGAFLKISEQIKAGFEGKTLDEAIQYQVSRVRGRHLFSHRLKTVFLSIGMMNRVID